MELQKYMEDISNAVEEIEDGVKDRQDELNSALDKANNFDSTIQVTMHWNLWNLMWKKSTAKKFIPMLHLLISSSFCLVFPAVQSSCVQMKRAEWVWERVCKNQSAPKLSRGMPFGVSDPIAQYVSFPHTV